MAAGPRWRWELAQQAAQYPDFQATYVLKDADEQTVRAYKFIRADKRGIAWLGEEVAARDIYLKQPSIRRYIECMFLGGCKDIALIADMADVSEKVVEIYHDFFFDVKNKLHKEAWIANHFFGGETFKPLARFDTDGIYHRIAWLGGVTLYRAMVGRPTPELREQIGKEINDILKQMLERQCLLISQTLGHGGELGIETMRLTLELTNAAVKDALPQHAKEVSLLQKSMQTFLGQVPLTVADTDTTISLLSADGFEPRAISPATIKDAEYVTTNV